eukprot:m.103952 g.103952  ORF g.103952 m.103952 type:complete len:62 (-) comp22427_c0_seq1:14-199(-)
MCWMNTVLLLGTKMTRGWMTSNKNSDNRLPLLFGGSKPQMKSRVKKKLRVMKIDGKEGRRE